MIWTMKELPAFFNVASDKSGVIMGLGKDFDETQDYIHKVLNLYYREGFFDSEPHITLISVKDIKVIKDFDFGPIVKETLGLKDRTEPKKK
jgi:hypothetical protein